MLRQTDAYYSLMSVSFSLLYRCLAECQGRTAHSLEIQFVDRTVFTAIVCSPLRFVNIAFPSARFIGMHHPATACSPGCSARTPLRPQDAVRASPNQVRCMHVGWDNQTEALRRWDMKKPQRKLASAILAPGRFHLRCFAH